MYEERCIQNELKELPCLLLYLLVVDALVFDNRGLVEFTDDWPGSRLIFPLFPAEPTKEFPDYFAVWFIIIELLVVPCNPEVK